MANENNFKERLQELQQRMKAIDYPNDFDWKKEFEFEVDEFSHHEELFELFEENFPFTFDEEKGFTVGNASWEDMQKLERILRIETAFGIPAEELMKIQWAWTFEEEKNTFLKSKEFKKLKKFEK